MKRTFAILLSIAVWGCTPPPPASVALPPVVAGAGAGLVFTLSCHSASTATSRQVHCIRTDTRTGDLQRVNLDKLPVSAGPTGAAAAPPGRYQTACATAASAEQADFYCVRLNTESGEMMMINLTKVGTVP
jgi:hypothetical protein